MSRKESDAYMRINPKIYALAEGYEPFERQEFDGRLVELFELDDFPQVYEQNVPKGKFVVWSSADGTNYRLFIEKGFYNEVKELYSQPINKIWLDFWDRCDDTTKKYNYRVMIPLAIVCLCIYLILSFIPGISSWAIYPQIGVFVLFIIGMFVIQKVTKNKMNQFNHESVDLIKQELTVEGFERVIQKQKDYTDRFFEEKQREIDEEIAREEAADKGEVAYIDEDKEETNSEVEDKVTADTLNTTVNTNELEEKVEDDHE